MRLSCSCRVLHPPPTTPCSAPRPPPPPLPRVHQVEGREDQGDERGLGGVGPFGYPTLLRTMYIINCRLALATFCTTTTTTMYVCVYYQLNVTEHKKIEKFYLFYFYLDRVFICHTNLPTQKMSFFCPFIGKKTDHCLSYFRPEEAETQKHVNQPDDLWVRPQLFRKISFCSETEKIVV